MRGPDRCPHSKQPHIVLILCDQLRADAMGFMGNSLARTPHLDALSRAGPTPILFDNQHDPWQLENIAAQQPAMVETLTGELNVWLRRTRDPWERI